MSGVFGAAGSEVDRGAEGCFGSLHHPFVHRRVRMDRAGDLVGRGAQPAGQRRLGEHLRNGGADQMGAQQVLLRIENQLDKAVAVSGGRGLARSREGEAADPAVDARSRASCSVMPTDATSGEVKMHDGMVV